MTIISLLLRLISLLITVIFILPLMFKEVKVRDHLASLRMQLLAFGIGHSLTNLVSIYFIVDILIHQTPQKILNLNLQLINGLFFLFLSIIGYLMYHSSYTDNK